MANRKTIINSRAFKDNFGQFMLWGGFYANTPTITILLVLFFCYFASFLAYTIVLTLDDLKLMGESAHFTLFRVTAAVIIFGFWKGRKDLDELFQTLGPNKMHDYGQTITKTILAEMEETNKKYEERKKKYGNGFIITTTIVLVMFILRAIYELITVTHEETYSDDGINRNLPVASYFPYDTKSTLSFYITLMCEVCVVMVSYFMILGNDCTFIAFSEDILRELEIISIGLRHIEERSNFVFSENKGKVTMKESVGACLKHSVRHHQTLIRSFSIFKRFCFYMLFIMLSGGAFEICLSGLMLTSEKIKVQDKSVFVVFLLNEMYHIFIFCYYGEMIAEKSEGVGDALYSSSWTGIFSEVKVTIVLMKMRSKNPLTLSGGGFMAANFETFGNVLRAAYSYLNLLQAANDL